MIRFCGHGSAPPAGDARCRASRSLLASPTFRAGRKPIPRRAGRPRDWFPRLRRDPGRALCDGRRPHRSAGRDNERWSRHRARGWWTFRPSHRAASNDGGEFRRSSTHRASRSRTGTRGPPIIRSRLSPGPMRSPIAGGSRMALKGVPGNGAPPLPSIRPPIRVPIARPRQGSVDHRHPHIGARHRRQHHHLSVVRGVLLKPLVNRDEDQLMLPSVRAPVASAPRTPTSPCPRFRTFASSIKTLSAFGDFSTVEFTMVGLGEPRVVRAGVVSGTLLRRDGPAAGARPAARRRRTTGRERPGAAVLTHAGSGRRPSKSDPSVHRQRRSGSATRAGHHRRRARTVGALSDRNRAHRQRRDQPAPLSARR